jgi:spoIIIJ-associated protein
VTVTDTSPAVSPVADDEPMTPTNAAVPEQEATTAPAEGAVSRETSSTPSSDKSGSADLETEGEVAADYLEGLLDIADLDGDIDMDVENDRATVSLVGGDLSVLVGDEGQVLDALQELTRLAVLRETGQRSRLMLDVDGFRAARRATLTELGREAAEAAATTGEPVRLEPMNPFERKVVHDAVAAAGLRSESEGEEPRRFVVVLPV